MQAKVLLGVLHVCRKKDNDGEFTAGRSKAALLFCLLLVVTSNFYCWPPKVALLFWFFGDFRCGALLFIVIHVI